MFTEVIVLAVVVSLPLAAIAVGGKVADKYAAWNEADKAARKRKLAIIRNR